MRQDGHGAVRDRAVRCALRPDGGRWTLSLDEARPHLGAAFRLVPLLALSKGLALLASVVVARQFDREISGLLFFIGGLVTLSLSFTTLGLTASASYHYARNLARRRFARNRQALHLVLAVAVLPSLAAGLLASAMSGAGPGAGSGVATAVAFACFMAAIRHWAKTVFTIEGRREWGLVHDGLLFNAVLIPGLLLPPSKTEGMALAVLACAALVSGFAALWHAARLSARPDTNARRLPPGRYARRLLAIGLPAMAAQGSGVLLNRIDVVMLGPLSTAGAVADYAVAVRLTYMAGVLAEIAALLLTPHLVAAAASRDPARQWRLLRLTMVSQAAATLVLAAPLMLFAGDVIRLVFGEAYLSAAPVFLLLMAGRLATCAFAPALILFTGLGCSARLARINMAAALVNLALNAALIPAFGAQGAAAAAFVGLLLTGVCHARIARGIYRRDDHAE